MAGSLEGREDTVLVPPFILAFAPDLEAFEEFRSLTECRIESETLEEQQRAQRHDPALVLTYTLSYQPSRVTLSAGQGDDIEVSAMA